MKYKDVAESNDLELLFGIDSNITIMKNKINKLKKLRDQHKKQYELWRYTINKKNDSTVLTSIDNIPVKVHIGDFMKFIDASIDWYSKKIATLKNTDINIENNNE